MKAILHIGALTRVYYDKEVEVPDDTTQEELDDMAYDLYQETDADEFEEDKFFWERGECWGEAVEDD